MRPASGGSTVFRTVDFPGAADSGINAVNDHGVVLGTYFDNAGGSFGFIESGRRPPITLNYPGTSGVTHPSAMNDADISDGNYQDAGGVFDGWIRSATGKFTQIDDPLAGTQNGQGTAPQNINDAGIIVGDYVDNNGVIHGFVDRNGTFTTVDAPGAGTASGQGTYVLGINDEGVLTGDYVDASGLSHSFVDILGSFFEFEAPGAGTGPGQGSYAGGSATPAESLAT